MRPEWFPDWTGEACAIVAGGPSVNEGQVGKLRGRCRVIVVNNSFRLAPWADALYAADARWWEVHRDAIGFAGLKITQDRNTAMHHKLRHVTLYPSDDERASRICVEELGKIGRGGNSAFQALNLAVQFWVRHILLLGCDFTGEHWHGKHEGVLKNPRPQTLEGWRAVMDAQADTLKSLGCDVVNVSGMSMLQAYPRMGIDDAFDRFGIAAGLRCRGELRQACA